MKVGEGMGAKLMADGSVSIGCSYKVAVRDNVTREVEFVTVGQPWGPGSLEWWTEGQMACDHERHLLLTGEDTYVRHDRGVRYAVLYAELADGSRVAIDEPLVLH